MSDDLFAALDNADRQRLRAAGWVEVQRWTRTYWHRPGSPDELYPLDEALKLFARLTKEAPA